MKSPHTTAKSFTLSGKLVGFVKDGRKLKGIKIKVGGIKYRVKLAKPLREALPLDVKKGQPVQVSGEVKQKKSGELKLRAAEIQVLDEAARPFLDLIDGEGHTANEAGPEPVVLGALEPEIAMLDAPKDIDVNGKSKTPKAKAQTKILICQKGSCWKKRGGQTVCERLEKRLSDRGLTDAVTIKKTGCMDRCKSGPNLVVMPGKARYGRVGKADIEKIIDQHVLQSSH
ncbi:MAG: NAD(P)H-dependent oxidoreductase subunit E [Elainellaceae cyanobacterium]